MGAFKDFLSRAYKICTEKYLQNEIDILMTIFTENGQDRHKLTNIATEYLRNITKPKSNGQNNTKNTKNIIKLHGCQFLALNFEKNLKRKILKLYSHQELI